MARIAVIGAGQWGTTLAALLCENGHAVRLWAREPEVVDAIARCHENTPFLPGIPLPPALLPTNELAVAMEHAQLLVMAVPSRWMRAACQSLAVLVPRACRSSPSPKGWRLPAGSA